MKPETTSLQPTAAHDKTPKAIVALLNQYIIGQDQAKRAVAIAIRNRWRRLQLETLKDEITPKNILMIGPTGVGKTEIARRISSITSAPFIKVEATKFTEVGYVGRDVDSIIRDLVSQGIQIIREQALEDVQAEAAAEAEEIILESLMPKTDDDTPETTTPYSATKEAYRNKLKSGELDERMIDIEIRNNIGIEIMTPAGMEEMSSQLQNIFHNLPQDKGKVKKMKVADAREYLQQEQAQLLLNEEQIRQQAIDYVEENGIVFIDEIDKVVKSSQSGGDVSREGVQRDLLPLIEGCAIQTKIGTVRTDHILFIASGAFMACKPSDMISELQGRLPIRVELDALSTSDLKRILTEPKSSLTKQYQALLSTEGVKLEFTEDGLNSIADIAYQTNEKNDNIGARRLHTIMEKLLENVSFDAPDLKASTVVINQDYVNQQFHGNDNKEDLSEWIL